MIKQSILEFLGATAISFFGSITRLNDKEDYLAISFTYFLIYACLVYSFKGISSAHFNPIVSLSLIFTNQITLGKALFYIFSQLTGSILGAFMVHIFYVFPANIEVFYYGEPEICDKNKFVGAAMELIGVFILIWVYSSLYENTKSPKHITGIAIGGVYLISISALGEFSGGTLNLVSIFGPSIFSTNFGDWLYYIPAQILGGFLSCLIYRLFLFGKSTEADDDEITELESKKIK